MQKIDTIMTTNLYSVFLPPEP